MCLVERHLWFLWDQALQLWRRLHLDYGYHVEEEELWSEAVLYAYELRPKYDPARGSFITFLKAHHVLGMLERRVRYRLLGHHMPTIDGRQTWRGGPRTGVFQ